MEKLSEAGQLYLKDYTILNEARNDVNRFLNEIVERIAEIIDGEIHDLSNKKFELSIWKNESSRGHLSIFFKNKIKNEFFRKGSSDINVVYKDVRNILDLESQTVKVYVYTPVVQSKLEEEFKELSLNKLDYNIYESEILNLDLESSSKSAEIISECILDKCKDIADLLNEFYKINELNNKDNFI